MKLLTFLICTRNGSATLAECIAHIGRQQNISHDAFEVIVVDNGSTDDTAAIAQSALAGLRSTTKFAVETKEGKVNAFLRGLAMSEAPFVAIVDDDNLIGEEFAFRTTQLFADFPQLGMVGSANTLEAENVPAWFSLAPGMYGCGRPHLEGEIKTIDENRVIASHGVIAGAGSTFRKDPLVRALELGFRFSNEALRKENLTSSGEDTELCYLFQHCGYWFGSDRRITLQHRISPKRLTWPYARRLARGNGAGGTVVDAFLWMGGQDPRPSSGTWWWLAARRVRRMVTLLPGVLSNTARPSRVALSWEEQLGGLIRLCRERGAFTRKMQEMRASRWARELHNYRAVSGR